MDTRHANLLARLEHFYDAVPRDAARVEDHGGCVLFVREGAGWPFYARPRLGADRSPTLADLTAVRARQRQLGLPEALEWVHEVHPELLAVARSAGLAVLEAPLMVLDPTTLARPAALAGTGAQGEPGAQVGPAALAGTNAQIGSAGSGGATVRLLAPSGPTVADDVAARRAVAAVGFSVSGTGRGEAGPAQRDAARTGLDVAVLDEERTRLADGSRYAALAETPTEGALASGMAMRVGDIAEIAGVATLPSARRRGLATAITATLAHALLADGVEVIFLSAGSEEIARIYLRVGFRRIGTACIAEPPTITP
ncbi:GNAT family N-acetyltransferase [Micromonospora radicis]|uniref:GNAT family N-acetyltransferase n=1 Tax=Micromonospora radicis TaxID=1894971 RepID=A0A418MV06_9ACTN|nr:GNAT family N-acetyltransferase [Micromonospora radicis]RIV38339.1 GNAT family N-acetyltransferase [Micromonospora radicis]